MAKVTYEFDAETGKAVAGFLKIVEAQKGAERQAKKTAKETTGGIATMEQAVSSLALKVSSGLGFAAGASIAVSSLRMIDDYMRAISTKIDEASGKMRTFALLQNGSPETQGRFQRVADIGNKYGMKSWVAWDTFQGIQSTYGNFNAALEPFRQVAIASQAQMDPTAVADFMAAGKTKGLEPWEGAYLPYRAGQISQKTPEVMAKASRSMSFWQDPYLAMAAAPSVLTQTSPEEYHSYLSGAGRLMSKTTGPMGTLKSKLGIPEGATELEIIQALAGGGYSTTSAFEKAGVQEITQTKSLAAIVASYMSGELTRNLNALRSDASPDYIEKQLGVIEQNVPLLRMQSQIESLAAKIDTDQILGPQGIRSHATKLLDLKNQKALEDVGMGWADKFGGWSGSRLVGQYVNQNAYQEYLRNMYEGGVGLSADQEVELYKSLPGSDPSKIQNVPYGGKSFVPESVLRDLIDALNRIAAISENQATGSGMQSE